MTGPFDLAPAISNLLRGVLGEDETIEVLFNEKFGLGAAAGRARQPAGLPGRPRRPPLHAGDRGPQLRGLRCGGPAGLPDRPARPPRGPATPARRRSRRRSRDEAEPRRATAMRRSAPRSQPRPPAPGVAPRRRPRPPEAPAAARLPPGPAAPSPPRRQPPAALRSRHPEPPRLPAQVTDEPNSNAAVEGPGGARRRRRLTAPDGARRARPRDRRVPADRRASWPRPARRSRRSTACR